MVFKESAHIDGILPTLSYKAKSYDSRRVLITTIFKWSAHLDVELDALAYNLESLD